MDQFGIMGVLESGGELLNIGNNDGEWNVAHTGMAVAQSAVGSVVHDDKGRFALNAEVQHADNVGMDELCKIAGLGAELSAIIFCYLCIHDFNGGLCVEVDMLA